MEKSDFTVQISQFEFLHPRIRIQSVAHGSKFYFRVLIKIEKYWYCILENYFKIQLVNESDYFRKCNLKYSYLIFNYKYSLISKVKKYIYNCV